MARTARAVSSTGLYFVILRGVTDIFKNDSIKLTFKELAEKYLDKGLCGINFTDDHVYLLIEESENGISKDMKPLTTSFARTYNRENSLSGKVFADRFKSVPIEDETTKTQCINFLINDGDLPVFSGQRTASGLSSKKTAKQKNSAPKKTSEKKSVTKKNVSKKADTKKIIEAEPIKEEPKPAVRKRNDLPSWLL